MRSLAVTTLALLTALTPLSARGTRREWAFAAFSHLKRSEAEKGSPLNSQPLRVDAGALAQALASIHFLAGAREIPLFAPEELEPMAAALAEALALAGPGEDLELMSTRKRESGFFAGSRAVTARVFAQDGKLNVIVHDTRLDYRNEYNLENRMPTFTYGSRATQGPVVLKAAQARRADWVVLPLGGAASGAPSAPNQPAPQVVVPPLPVAPAGRPASVEEKLKGLKRLREQNLITEEEYARTKKELLKEFTREEALGAVPK